MVTIKLESTAEDIHIIQELKKIGVPDDVIQMAYDETMRRREAKCSDHSLPQYPMGDIGD